jgi:hypothetical protein
MAFDFAGPDDDVKSLIEVMTPSLLFWLYESNRSYDEVERRTFQVVDEISPGVSPRWHARLIALWVERNTTSLEVLGVIEWNNSETMEEYGRTHRRSGDLSLTELGVYWVQESAAEYGFTTPIGEPISFDLNRPREEIVASLADALERGGPTAMVELLMAADGPVRVAEVVGKMWMSEHPATEAVLADIEATIPNAKVRRMAHRSLWRVRNR